MTVYSDTALESFNWATSFQKWILALCATTITNAAGFQLGHFFSEMDTGPATEKISVCL